MYGMVFDACVCAYECMFMVHKSLMGLKELLNHPSCFEFNAHIEVEILQ